MTTAKRWTIDVVIDEEEGSGRTRAEARLDAGDDTITTTALIGSGTARRNPRDVNIPTIGDELAVARALDRLAHELLDAAADQIEDVDQARASLDL